MKKNYIGLANTFHDSSVAIVNSEGKVVFAEATERYLQNKRAMNCLPDVYMHIGKVIDKYCEPDAELVVAQSWSENTQEIMDKMYSYNLESREAFQKMMGGLPEAFIDQTEFNAFSMPAIADIAERTNRTLRYELTRIPSRRDYCDFEVRKFNHHLTHAATTCMTSPFSECACVVLDGYGEGASACAYIYKDGQLTSLRSDEEVLESRSISSFYMMVCDLCGFGYFKGEEWKVMGLAAYGKLDEDLYSLFSQLIQVDGLHVKVKNFYKYIKLVDKIYEHQRKPDQPAIEMADLAYTGQVVFSELVFKYLKNVKELTGMKNVALGGGSFLNSWTNGEIEKNTGFENAYIFSAPGDDGNSIGAALLAYKQDNPDFIPADKFQSPYLGHEINKQSLQHFFDFGGMEALTEHRPDDICEIAAKLLAEGRIIGWVQGRAEFGPRALGNRSILANPTHKDCKEKINSKVKFREEFRPFAPSILHEHGEEYFEDYRDTPYMERTLRFKPEVMDKVPGVVHENKTGRLQSVHKEYNEKYYNVINEFYKLTGVPMVLNTSFNVMGKPIIHSFEDAIAVFFTSGLDALIIDDYIIYKNGVK